MTALKDFWDWVVDYRDLLVWHQDSPGMIVVVRRSRFTRLWAPKEFSMVGEKHL
jgi:hypothetical protein